MDLEVGSVSVAVGRTALAIACAKAALPTMQLFFPAMLCDVLVCLAVWMSFAARGTADKVMVIVPPIAAFVAMRLRALDCQPLSPALWPGHQDILKPGVLGCDWAGCGGLSQTDWGGALHNIAIATLGNLLVGSLMVGAVYWFVYLRQRA